GFKDWMKKAGSWLKKKGPALIKAAMQE
uniref:U1-poneritoxin-Na3a n=1 Tax=Neoponera apicalis TaxID=2320211 RepID=GTX3A_NEOAP|nr:RecName: Full=U1-poneritoxin-Na3a; Short=U1-PONTX-Na3a; AltName: Full=Poneratoxin; AltName: Full=Ponericin Pa I1 [Neoponera apicalis]